MAVSRSIRIEGDLAYVPLTQGYEAVIDADDAALVGQWLWCSWVTRRRDGSVRSVYAKRGDYSQVKPRTVLMHRIIAGTPDDMETDHIDGNGLNNRRSNLRAATITENRRNKIRSYASKSGVKGVHWVERLGKWRAQICADRKVTCLGLFDTVDGAAHAYAKASATLHGKYGRYE
jgi:hypothetical protein